MEDIEFEERLHKNLDTIWDISIFNYFLLFVTSFLVFAVILAVLGIVFYFGFVPALLIVAISYFRNKKSQSHIRTVERGNPSLKERLSAAYDNMERDNFIVRGLVREVSSDLN